RALRGVDLAFGSPCPSDRRRLFTKTADSLHTTFKPTLDPEVVNHGTGAGDGHRAGGSDGHRPALATAEITLQRGVLLGVRRGPLLTGSDSGASRRTASARIQAGGNRALLGARDLSDARQERDAAGVRGRGR